MLHLNKIILISFLLISNLAFAQNDSICGFVVDEKGIPVEFVNVVMQSARDSSFISGTVTGRDGKFALQKTSDDNFLKVSAIGYKSLSVYSLEDTPLHIVLTEEAYNLGGVEIKGERQTTSITQNGLITQIAETPLANIGSAHNIIRQLPMVTETENGFQVFGKGKPEIYIDGHKLTNAVDLDFLKSSDVKSVELITSPSPQYGASVPVVINIKRLKKKSEGIGLEAGADYKQGYYTSLDGYASISYRNAGWDINDEIRYELNNRRDKRDITQNIEVDTLWQENNHEITHQKEQKVENVLSLVKEINSDNSLGFKYTVGFHPHGFSNTRIESEVFADKKYADDITTNGSEKIHERPLHHANVFYSGKIGSMSVNFDADYVYEKMEKTSFYVESGHSSDNRFVTSDSKISSSAFGSKIVFSLPLLGGSIDFGGEYLNTIRKDDYVNIEDIVPTMFSKLKENSVSPFAEYSRMLPIGLLKIGARYEFSDFKYYDKGKYVPGPSRSYNHFFPSASFGTRLGALGISLNYTSRTQRPTYTQLSNNTVYGNRFTWQKGNALLKPEYIHDISLQGMWKWIAFSIDYSNTENAIIYWAEQVKDNEAITCMSYKNLGHLNAVTAAVVLSPKFGLWSPKLTVAMRKQHLNLNTQIGNYRMNKPLWLGSLTNSLSFSKTFTGFVNLSLQGHGNYQNVYMNKTSFVADIILNKTFLAGRLEMQLKASDLFKKQRDGNLVYSNKMQLYTLNTYDSRSFSVVLKYHFNAGGKHRDATNGYIDSEINRF